MVLVTVLKLVTVPVLLIQVPTRSVSVDDSWILAGGSVWTSHIMFAWWVLFQ